MNNEKEIIGQIIQARKAKKLSQTQLGEITGNSQQVISKIERGKCIPNLGTLCKIMDALECDIIIKKPGETIVNITDAIKKEKEMFKKDFEDELHTYGKAKFVNKEQELCYDASIKILMNIGKIIPLETVMSKVAETMMCFELSRVMFKKNPKKINLSFLQAIYKKMKSAKIYFEDDFEYEICNAMESIDCIYRIIVNS